MSGEHQRLHAGSAPASGSAGFPSPTRAHALHIEKPFSWVQCSSPKTGPQPAACALAPITEFRNPRFSRNRPHIFVRTRRVLAQGSNVACESSRYKHRYRGAKSASVSDFSGCSASADRSTPGFAGASGIGCGLSAVVLAGVVAVGAESPCGCVGKVEATGLSLCPRLCDGAIRFRIRCF